VSPELPPVDEYAPDAREAEFANDMREAVLAADEESTNPEQKCRISYGALVDGLGVIDVYGVEARRRTPRAFDKDHIPLPYIELTSNSVRWLQYHFAARKAALREG